MATPGQKYFTRFPFTYAGKPLDRGQIFELTGQANDEKLVRLGYVMTLNPRDPVSNCGRCGAKFIGDDYRDGHGKIRHSGNPVTHEVLEAEQQRAMQRTPLKLDKTKATIEAA